MFPFFYMDRTVMPVIYIWWAIIEYTCILVSCPFGPTPWCHARWASKFYDITFCTS